MAAVTATLVAIAFPPSRGTALRTALPRPGEGVGISYNLPAVRTVHTAKSLMDIR